MKSITSRDNTVYKEIKQLATSSQVRRKAGRTLLDGVHLCQAYSQHAGMPRLCVVADDVLDHHEVRLLIADCEEQGTQCISLPHAMYHAISQVDHGVGIMYVVDTPTPEFPVELLQSSVMLDNLQDPGNLGSILRSAAAAGIQNIFCSHGTAFAWSPKVMRAGMGAHFLLNIFENVNLEAVLATAKIPVLATSSHTSQTIYQTNLRQPVIWLFGHEGQGISDALMEMATDKVTIPQQASIESLNVAASAAICFFE